MERFNCTKCDARQMRPEEARVHSCEKKYLPRVMMEATPDAELGFVVEMATSATPEGDRKDYLSLEEANDLVTTGQLEALWELVELGRKAKEMRLLDRHTQDLWHFFATVTEEHYFKLKKAKKEPEPLEKWHDGKAWYKCPSSLCPTCRSPVKVWETRDRDAVMFEPKRSL